VPFASPLLKYCSEKMLANFDGKRMIKRCFLHSGNDPKSGKLSSGMGGRFEPESACMRFGMFAGFGKLREWSISTNLFLSESLV